MGEKKYDVSISHAYGDKDGFLNELALALREEGKRVWYTGFDLKKGDSIAESVKRILEESRYGLLIISPAYLEKRSAIAELNSLLLANKSGRIIPVLHNIAVKQLAMRFPSFTHKLSISSVQGISQVVKRILKMIRGAETLPALQKKKTHQVKAKTAGKKNSADTGLIVLGGSTGTNMIGSITPMKKRGKAREQ